MHTRGTFCSAWNSNLLVILRQLWLHTAEPDALLSALAFSGALAVCRNRLPPTTHGFLAAVASCWPRFPDFSPTTDLPGGALALVTSRDFFPGGFHMHIH